MPTIHPIINLNGESRQYHIDARIGLRGTLQEAMRRLSALRPHGRDYPGAEGRQRYDADLTEYQARFATLDALANVLLDEALALHREQEA